MFIDSVFFMPQYIECKEADIEKSYNKVSKNDSFQKSAGRREGFSYLAHGL